MYTYYPSCNFAIASPAAAKKARAYFKERMPVGPCCRVDKKEFGPDDTALIVCQACREVLSQKGHVQSIWEYLLTDENFVFPNYQGINIVLQDCYRDKDHPEVHLAVREVLKKMNIHVLEAPLNKENSNFCGTLHYTTTNPQLLNELTQYPDTKISKLPEDLQIKLMQEHVASLPKAKYIVCDCNRCAKGITMGGGHAVHLLELVMGTT